MQPRLKPVNINSMITNSPTPKQLVPPLVKIRYVMSLFSVSKQTVHNLIFSGDLKAASLNSAAKERKHLRITRDSLLALYQKRYGHSLERALAHAHAAQS
jgi:hypothetical protein